MGCSAPDHPGCAGVLVGGGDMGARLRAVDWSRTPLGPPDGWPASLRTAVRIMLTCRQPMFVWWGPTLINLYNDAYRPSLGLRHPAALGRPAAEVWHEIWDVVGERAARALSTSEGTYDEALQLVMERNGFREETYYTLSYSPIPGDDGRPSGILGACIDETQRIVDERQLGLLRDLATAAADARSLEEACALSASSLAAHARDLPFALVYQAERDRELTLVAAAGVEVAAVRPASGWAGLLAELHDGTGPRVVPAAELVAPVPSGAWPEPPSQAVILPVTPPGQAGRRVVLAAGLSPYRRLDAAYHGLLELVAKQIRASIASAEAYDEERRRAEELHEADRRKDELLATLAHELRNPLAPLRNGLDLLRQAGAQPEASAATLAMMERQITTLGRLLDDLLDVRRISHGFIALRRQTVDVIDVVQHAEEISEPAIAKAGHRLAVELPGEPVFVDGDPTRLAQVVANLLNNAAAYTEPGGDLRLTVARAGDRVTVEVADSGIGLAPDQLASVFDVFTHSAGQPGRAFGGLGLGLHLVKQLVELHGGTVTAASPGPGHGSVFTVSLPAVAGPTAAADLAVGPAEPVASQRVLVADDNLDAAETLADLFDLMGSEVKIAHDGAQALTLAERFQPSLVVLDIGMPGLSGHEVCRRLRTLPGGSDALIVALSGWGQDEHKRQSRAAGFDEHLVKPIELATIERLLAAAGRRPR